MQGVILVVTHGLLNCGNAEFICLIMPRDAIQMDQFAKRRVHRIYKSRRRHFAVLVVYTVL